MRVWDSPQFKIIGFNSVMANADPLTPQSASSSKKTFNLAKQFSKWLVFSGGENAVNQAFIDHDTIQKVIDQAPDSEWKLIIALSRFGGLRCPSEVQALKWTDIDWHKGRFKVTSDKTKRHNKGFRMVPIFPELLPYLNDAQESAPDGAVHVVARYRGRNIRTQFGRMVENAGLEKWPRLFHNLRASRQTELENDFPSHVVCDWIGNTPKVADKHYLQTTDDHFERAKSAVAETVANDPETVAETVAEQQSTDEQETKNAPAKTEANAIGPIIFELSENPLAPRKGLSSLQVSDCWMRKYLPIHRLKLSDELVLRRLKCSFNFFDATALSVGSPTQCSTTQLNLSLRSRVLRGGCVGTSTRTRSSADWNAQRC